MIARTVCRHKAQPSGEPLVVTMIVGGVTGKEFLKKLEVKVPFDLLHGQQMYMCISVLSNFR